jgi:transcriptional regulator with XRE-family HTH domain
MAAAYADVSLRDLGAHLGVSPMAVSKWASGKCYPRSSHLMAICDKCGVPIEWLMETGNPFTGQDRIEALRRELKDVLNRYEETP